MRTRSSARADALKNFSVALPLELLELVFRFLRPSDGRDRSPEESPFKATSLVCRSWRVPSQCLLFHSLPILFLPSFAPHFSAFLLSAPHWHIASAVRGVKFSDDGLQELKVTGQINKRDTWAAALRPLKNVCYIRVSCIEEPDDLELIVDLIQSVWSSTVTHFTLTRCTFKCFHTVFAPLSSCTDLRTIDFGDGNDPSGNTYSATDYTRPPKCCADGGIRTQLSNLQKIMTDLSSGALKDSMRWLSLPNVLTPHLRQVEMSCVMTQDAGHILRDILFDPSITLWERINKVTLSSQDPRITTEDDRILDSLSPLSHVSLHQFAHLEMFTDCLQPNGLIDALTWWETLIRDHTSLQTLSLSFFWVATRIPKRVRLKLEGAWDRLDMTLSQDTHASLREVKFVDEERRRITDANPDLVELIREVLPQSSNKGLLSFS